MPILYALIAFFASAAPVDHSSTLDASGQALADDACELSFNPGDLAQLLEGSFVENAGEWVEYAPLNKNGPDTTAVMRLSIIKDPETQKTGFELWFDKLGEFAVRSRIATDGTLIQELKQGSRAFLVPPAEEKKPNKASCRIENIIKKELQSSVRESKKPIRIRIKTLAGEFDCREVSVKSFKGELKVFVSETAPLMKIVRFVLWNGNAIELVAHGKNAYSAFSKDLTILPMSKLTEMMEALQQNVEQAESKPQIPTDGQTKDGSTAEARVSSERAASNNPSTQAVETVQDKALPTKASQGSTSGEQTLPSKK